MVKMIRKRIRGNTMALYAAFLVTVGMPLLALGVDGSRVMVMKVRLRQATEAACEAYANSLDIKKFIFEDTMVFTDGNKNANRVFSAAIGKSGSFVPVEYRKPGSGVNLQNGHTVEVVVIQCYGTGFIKSIIPLFPDFVISTSAAAQTKFSTSN
jgi:hypothetical protein